jgi:hypothetical protein
MVGDGETQFRGVYTLVDAEIAGGLTVVQVIGPRPGALIEDDT